MKISPLGLRSGAAGRLAVLAALLSAGLSTAHADPRPRELDQSKAFFSDDFESGSQDGRWNYNQDGEGATAIFGEKDPDGRGNRILSLSISTAGYVQPYVLPQAWEGTTGESGGYGADIRFFVPKKTASASEAVEVFGLAVLCLQFSAFEATRMITLAEQNDMAQAATDDRVTIKAWGTTEGAGQGGDQFLELNRGEWNTLQVEHRDNGPKGMPVFVNGRFWMYLNTGTELGADGLQLGNTQGSRDRASGTIFYDDVVVAPLKR